MDSVHLISILLLVFSTGPTVATDIEEEVCVFYMVSEGPNSFPTFLLHF